MLNKYYHMKVMFFHMTIGVHFIPVSYQVDL